MRCAAAIVVLVGLGWPAAVDAQRRAVRVGEVRGPGGAVVEARLPDALRDAGVDVRDDAGVEVTGRARARRLRTLTLRLVGDGIDATVRVRRRDPARLIADAAQGVAARLDEAAAPDASASPTEAPRVPAGGPTEGGAAPPPAAPARAGPDGSAEGGALGDPHGGDEALEYAVGVGWMARTLSFSDDVFDRLGEYALPAAPVVSTWVRWYPLLHWIDHPLAGVGITARLFGALGVRSTTTDGEDTFATSVDDFAVGLSYRARAHEMLRVEAELELGEARFAIDPEGPDRPGATGALIPPARYGYLRPAAYVWLDLPERVSIRAGAGWRAILDSGPFAYPEWFPRSTTTGVDLQLSVRWRFVPWLAARVFVEHTRYLTAISPEPGDALVAGGAADEWTRAGAELIVVLAGVRR